ncbi:MAG: 3-hydroxyacyl-CoA dehydrogenase NAD-binding domain-containing protein, partial [Pseudomonadota bacterium]
MAEFRKIGVVGAGQMGNGIAHVCALAGYDVVLNDISDDALSAAMSMIEQNMSRQMARDIISLDEMKTAMARIQPTSKMELLADIDLAIEAATENREVKEAIFRSLCQIVSDQTLLATNTSSISVTRLAASTDPGVLY